MNNDFHVNRHAMYLLHISFIMTFSAFCDERRLADCQQPHSRLIYPVSPVAWLSVVAALSAMCRFFKA
eukprot:scaffold15897_cov17-Prasinocladus_malaysianus.AAC.2